MSIDLILLIYIKAGLDLLEPEDPESGLAVHQNLLPSVILVFFIFRAAGLISAINSDFEFLASRLFS